MSQIKKIETFGCDEEDMKKMRSMSLKDYTADYTSIADLSKKEVSWWARKANDNEITAIKLEHDNIYQQSKMEDLKDDVMTLKNAIIPPTPEIGQEGRNIQVFVDRAQKISTDNESLTIKLRKSHNGKDHRNVKKQEKKIEHLQVLRDILKSDNDILDAQVKEHEHDIEEWKKGFSNQVELRDKRIANLVGAVEMKERAKKRLCSNLDDIFEALGIPEDKQNEMNDYDMINEEAIKEIEKLKSGLCSCSLPAEIKILKEQADTAVFDLTAHITKQREDITELEIRWCASALYQSRPCPESNKLAIENYRKEIVKLKAEIYELKEEILDSA